MGVKNLLQLDKQQKLFIQNAGVKLFKANKQKDENAVNFCLYRVCQDGLMYLLPFMHKRIYFVNEEFFVEILKKKEIRHDDISNEEIKNKLKEVGPGCIIIVNVKNKPKEDDLESKNYEQYIKNNFIDAFCCHNATTRITTMINKEHQHIFELKYKIENF